MPGASPSATALPGAGRAVADVERQLDAVGLRASLLVRDLDTGSEISLDAGRRWPLASLAKVPLALTALDAMRRGDLDASEPVVVSPEGLEDHSPGLGWFRHEARVALGDLVHLSVALSDNVAADALFELVPPTDVTSWLGDHGFGGIDVRHTLRELADVPRVESADPGLAQVLATTGRTPSAGHRVRQLDVARASTANARAMADLVAGIWDTASAIHPDVSRRMRSLLSANVHRHRLWPSFASDAAGWSSKTGTVLNLRHEVGVVEHGDGDSLVVTAFSESSVAAAVQPAAEATLADACRRLHDVLRGG